MNGTGISQHPLHEGEAEAAALEPRWAGWLALAVLMQACPQAWIDAELRAAGRAGQRQRALPPWLMVYAVMALPLWPDAPLEVVLRKVRDGLGLLAGITMGDMPAGKSAISQARARLGHEPLAALVHRLMQKQVQHVAAGRGAFPRFQGRCPHVLRCHLLRMPDTQANAAHFGYPMPRQALAVPGVRLWVLQQAGPAGPWVAARNATCRETPAGALESLLGIHLPADALLLAGDEPEDLTAVYRALAGPTAVVWQIRARHRPPIGTLLPDGSYLGEADAPSAGVSQPLQVRVIGYTLQAEGVRPRDATFLLTNLLDAQQAPALALVELHRQSLVSDVTVQRPGHAAPIPPTDLLNGTGLRSKEPGLVMQELWGRTLAQLALQQLWRGLDGPGRPGQAPT